MFTSNCVVCGSKKSRLIKEQEAKGLLSMICRIPIIGPLLTQLKIASMHLNIISMNEIINKFLLAGDKFMPEMHLRHPGFTYSASGTFTKNKERIKKI